MSKRSKLNLNNLQLIFAVQHETKYAKIRKKKSYFLWFNRACVYISRVHPNTLFSFGVYKSAED